MAASSFYSIAQKISDATGVPLVSGEHEDDFVEMPGSGGSSGSGHGEKDRSLEAKDRSLEEKFLIRLALALVSYGSSAPRTEYLVEKAAEKLETEAHVAVFSSLVLLVFPISDHYKSETVMVTVARSVNVDKLQKIDELANMVGQKEMNVSAADCRLRDIATCSGYFTSRKSQLLSYALSSFTSAPLFFSGSLLDAVISMLLGLGVGVLAILSENTRVFRHMLEFIAAFLVAIVARLCSIYLEDFKLCFFAISVSSLVWLLPGELLTVGISEVVEESSITGTSRIMRGLVITLQLGFGLAIGQDLVWWADTPVDKNCESPNMSPWWDVIWFLGFSIAANVLLKGRYQQWLGMTAAAGIGTLLDKACSTVLQPEASAAIASFGIGVTGGMFAQVTSDIPLSMILAGVQVLLPGGIGVQGVTVLLSGGDVVSGMSFVMNTVVICLSITIGLLVSKIAMHDGVLGVTKVLTHNSKTLQEDLRREAENSVRENEADEDTRVAI